MAHLCASLMCVQQLLLLPVGTYGRRASSNAVICCNGTEKT